MQGTGGNDKMWLSTILKLRDVAGRGNVKECCNIYICILSHGGVGLGWVCLGWTKLGCSLLGDKIQLTDKPYLCDIDRFCTLSDWAIDVISRV